MSNATLKVQPNHVPPAGVSSYGATCHATESPDRQSGFAARLRDATRIVHREAERTGFIAELIRGRASRSAYVLFLRNLVPIYTALEAALDAHHATSVTSVFAQPGLRRLPSLLSDLTAIEDIAEPTSGPLLPESVVYAAAITSAASGDGMRLVAHAYARYLGDLSGGQILKPIAARSLGLSQAMLRFYDFPTFSDPEAVKGQMRDALDTIPATSAAADGLIAEAIEAFRHNIALSSAVTRRLTT